MLKDNLNKLLDIATSDKHSSGALVARKEYDSIAGNIYEDDKSYENRMALFLEWYIFDRIFPKTNQTLLETIINENRKNSSSHMSKIFEGFKSNVHGLFIVKKIRDHSVRTLNLFDNQKYEVNESFGKLIFSKSGVFQGRLIFYDNMHHFTGSFCFHPEKAKKFIKQEIQKINTINHRNKRELKHRTAQFITEKKNLHKINSQIDKLKTNLLVSYSEKQISNLKNNLAELETKQNVMEQKYSSIESELKMFASEKTVREPKALQTQLILKLSYMQLVWERSRLIDLGDIYHN